MTCCYNIPETPEQKIDGVPYTLTSDDGVYMIKVVNICDLLDRLYPHRENGRPSSLATKKWCDENDSHYYAAPREDFSIAAAMREAIANRKSCVVVEDLS